MKAEFPYYLPPQTNIRCYNATICMLVSGKTLSLQELSPFTFLKYYSLICRDKRIHCVHRMMRRLSTAFPCWTLFRLKVTRIGYIAIQWSTLAEPLLLLSGFISQKVWSRLSGCLPKDARLIKRNENKVVHLLRKTENHCSPSKNDTHMVVEWWLNGS